MTVIWNGFGLVGMILQRHVKAIRITQLSLSKVNSHGYITVIRCTIILRGISDL